MKPTTLVALLCAATCTSAVAQPANAVVPAETYQGETYKADVDGDKKVDEVVVSLAADNASKITVTTATGKKSSVQYAQGTVQTLGPLFAVVPMDGKAGAEIIVRTSIGAVGGEYRVYTWKDGRLSGVNSPDTNKPMWSVAASLAGTAGWRRYVSKGKTYLERRSYILNSAATHYTGPFTTYQWVSGAWKKISTKNMKIKRGSTEMRYASGWIGLGPDNGK